MAEGRVYDFGEILITAIPRLFHDAIDSFVASAATKPQLASSAGTRRCQAAPRFHSSEPTGTTVVSPIRSNHQGSDGHLAE